MIHKFRPSSAATRDQDESEMLDRLRKWGTSPVPVPDRPSGSSSTSGSSTAPGPSSAPGPSIAPQIAALGNLIQSEKEHQTRRVLKRRAAGWVVSMAALTALILNAEHLGSWAVARSPDSLVGDVSVTGRVDRTSARLESSPSARLHGSAQVSAGGPLSGRELRMGSSVEAGPSGADVVAEATRAHLAPGATLDVRELSGGFEAWFVRRGSVRFQVDPQRHKQVMVETVDSKFEVVGTEFTVVAPDASDATPGSRLFVHHGTVRVSSAQGELALVGQNGQWHAQMAKTSDISPMSAPRATALGAQSREATGSRATTLAEENQLFRSALRARNAHQDREAIRAFHGLLTRYPKTSLRREAELEIARARERINANGRP